MALLEGVRLAPCNDWAVADPSMEIAWRLAEGLGDSPDLPHSLHTVEERARLVDKIDGSFIPTADNPDEHPASVIGRRLREIETGTEILADEIPDVLDRVNLGLRLWAGCLSSAKTIASGTLSGPNTPQIRAQIFSSIIDPRAGGDVAYRAGVEAAPAFHRLRRDDFFS